jgi:hypothetical protein
MSAIEGGGLSPVLIGAALAAAALLAYATR